MASAAATKELGDLCRVLLHDIYGELAESVVGILLAHGQQDASHIAKLAGIPLPTVHRSLVALVQNKFVLHWQRDKKTFYSANWPAIYALLWSGPVLEWALSKFPSNDLMPEIIKNMDVYGHMRAGDFIDAYEPHMRPEVESALAELLSISLLSSLQEHEFWPKADLKERFYQKHIARLAGDRSAPTSEAARKALALKEAEEEIERLSTSSSSGGDGATTTKGGQAGGSKAAKNLLLRGLAAGALAGQNGGGASASSVVDRQAVLCVNHAKFLVIGRNQTLVRLATKHIGAVTGRVYGALLECCEPAIRSCRQTTVPSVEFNVTSMDVVKKLSAQGVTTELLEEAIVEHTLKRGPSGLGNGGTGGSGGPMKKLRLNADGGLSLGGGIGEDNGGDDDLGDFYDDYVNEDAMDSRDDDPDSANYFNQPAVSVAAVNQHLQILAESDIKFVQNVGNKGGGEWFVPYGELCNDVRRATYDEIITNKYGHIAARLLRVIRDKGRVDEKMLTQIALLPAKDIRSNLTDLQNIGCLDLQEVPRGLDRAPGRTFYLWFHRSQRAYSLLLQDLYKSMTRIYTRIHTERKRHAILNSKLQREDVQGHEDEYLTAAEKQEMQRMRFNEEKLLVQLLRIENLVRIFRDY